MDNHHRKWAEQRTCPLRTMSPVRLQKQRAIAWDYLPLDQHWDNNKKYLCFIVKNNINRITMWKGLDFVVNWDIHDEVCSQINSRTIRSKMLSTHRLVNVKLDDVVDMEMTFKTSNNASFPSKNKFVKIQLFDLFSLVEYRLYCRTSMEATRLIQRGLDQSVFFY